LWLECNGFTKIENLSHLTELRCLYLQQNLITKIEGLEGLVNLVSLNLSSNRIKIIEGLQNNINLETLNVSQNVLTSVENIKGVTQAPAISSLDLSGNYIEEPEDLVDTLKQMKNLKCFYFKGNPAMRNISNYRKVIISKIPSLTYLEDRPVFELDRITSEAWAKGGREAEALERRRYRLYFDEDF